MTTESEPPLSAESSWAAIPEDKQNRLLSNVWCSKCGHAVTIVKFTMAMTAGDLLLVGKCAECHADVARMIELG